MWAWGQNDAGQFGNGTTTASLMPSQVAVGYGAVAAGNRFTIGVHPDGTVWSWGDNYHGQLGTGTVASGAVAQLVVNPTLDGFLDLEPSIANTIPAAAVPPFLVQAKKSGEFKAQSLSVDVRGLLNYASPQSRTVRPAATRPTYKLYVVAYLGAQGFSSWYQLDSAKRWSGLQSPLAEYLSGVSLNSNLDFVLVDILDGIDLTSLIGARIFVGYGTDSDEMLSAGRYREVMTISAPQ
ncbi:MAG: hypothetical protein CFE44_24625 [Burkholderiales bacterium PBB4]|nr:MAG: hypothetical protein CFE44_24625 [Burkholderiales bacterium PBB4]